MIMQAFNDPELTVEEAHVVMCKILYEGWTDMPKELYEEAAKRRSGSWTVARKMKRI